MIQHQIGDKTLSDWKRRFVTSAARNGPKCIWIVRHYAVHNFICGKSANRFACSIHQVACQLAWKRPRVRSVVRHLTIPKGVAPDVPEGASRQCALCEDHEPSFKLTPGLSPSGCSAKLMLTMGHQYAAAAEQGCSAFATR